MPNFNQNRNVKKVFTDFVNKIFSLNTTWINDDVEVISLSGDNSPKAYEQYPWDNEKYPIVVLFGSGTQDDHWAIDSLISSSVRPTLRLGVTPASYLTLSQYPIATEITPAVNNMTIQSAEILVKYIGPYEEKIFIDLYDSGSSGPNSILASGSIQGTSTVGIDWLQTTIKPHITLTKDTTYYLTARAPSGSYYWFVDNNVAVRVNPTPNQVVYDGSNWTLTSGSAPIAKIHSPSVRRIGGGLYQSIRFFCEAKDLSTAQKINDLIFIYLHLAKHSNAGRRVKLEFPSTMTSMDFDFVSDLTDEGIYIKDVSKGAETVRVRGNDRLFAVDLTVTCYSSWTEDFDIPTLDDFKSTDLTSVQNVLNNYIE